MTLLRVLPRLAHQRTSAAPAGFKRRERNARRWRLLISEWIYEGIGPRYALLFFTTHVETRSAPFSNEEGVCG